MMTHITKSPSPYTCHILKMFMIIDTQNDSLIV
ncbi:hypothetical protein F383_33946 [Gossypium arboreum]|uniref:Uncharacterized protein n=1 Tax=Gossypium arboreum TaxID=29729 RepID=A0A0B0MZ12_GOSAR|nr:hypothetical protein F383_33946 [Gossypium arboreum]